LADQQQSDISSFHMQAEVKMRLKGILVGAALAIAFPAAPALAQTQAATVGMPVTDANGGAVGTVIAIQGDNIQVKTDKHEALLPKSSFAVDGNKLLFGMTQAELNDAIEKTLDAANAAVAAGATVKGLSGAEIGKIDSVTDGGVVIALSSGKKIQVAKTGVRGNPDGAVTVGLTAEQVDAQTLGSDPAPKGQVSAVFR
jgi:preprotein translocase subunit YajC